MPTAQGKQRMAQKDGCYGKHMQGISIFQNTGKTQRILFAQVLNPLILKVGLKHITTYARQISSFFSSFFQKLDISAKLVLCM